MPLYFPETLDFEAFRGILLSLSLMLGLMPWMSVTAYGDEVLKFGSVGQEVIYVQTLLRNLGFFSSQIDGEFGDSTTLAVMAFQRAVGLYVDGIVGAQTKAALGIQ